jgi:hypothetical protein
MAASGGAPYVVSQLGFLGSTCANGKKSDLYRNGDSAFDLMPPSMTVSTKRNQILRCIMAKLTSGIKMMDLQHFCGTAILALPSIPV